jgi:hypothetical protein
LHSFNATRIKVSVYRIPGIITGLSLPSAQAKMRAGGEISSESRKPNVVTGGWFNFIAIRFRQRFYEWQYPAAPAREREH